MALDASKSSSENSTDEVIRNLPSSFFEFSKYQSAVPRQLIHSEVEAPQVSNAQSLSASFSEISFHPVVASTQQSAPVNESNNGNKSSILQEIPNVPENDSSHSNTRETSSLSPPHLAYPTFIAVNEMDIETECGLGDDGSETDIQMNVSIYDPLSSSR